jgi:uncharacterized protein
MSPEERQLLVDLFRRTNAASGNPRDADAEAFIAEAVRLQPYAPYLLAQTVIVQEQALRAASDKLQQLEAENRDLKERGPAQQPGQPNQGGFLGGLGSLFGGSQPAQPARPASPQSSGPWGGAQQGGPSGGPWGGAQQGGPAGGPWGGAPQQPGGGGGFLKGALGAAAGVAGGMLLADSIRGLFHGPGSNPLGIGNGFGSQQAGLGGGDTVINNYYGDSGRDVQNASDSGPDDDDSYTSDADYQSDDMGSDDSYDV